MGFNNPICIPRVGSCYLYLLSLLLQSHLYLFSTPILVYTTPYINKLLLLLLIEIWLIYSIVLVSGIQQSDSVIFLQIIFYYRLLQDIEYEEESGGVNDSTMPDYSYYGYSDSGVYDDDYYYEDAESADEKDIADIVK